MRGLAAPPSNYQPHIDASCPQLYSSEHPLSIIDA